MATKQFPLEKACTFCKEVKPISDFYFRSNRNRYESRCKVCCKERTKHRRPEVQRENKLKKAFGITLATYNIMLESQDHVCAICGMPELVQNRSLSVDHDHKTGKIRQLLCGNCNHALGKFKDDPELCIKAAEYLTRHREV